MSNKTAFEEPKQPSKAENASTSYSETGFPVLFNSRKKDSRNDEHSQHNLFKEDTSSSHTDQQEKDKVPEQPRIRLPKNRVEAAKSPISQSPPQSVERFYHDEMLQLKRYIERAERINRVELNQLQKVRKPFGAHRLNNSNSNAKTSLEATHARQITTVVPKLQEKRVQQPLSEPQPEHAQINRIRDIYVSRNVRKNKTIIPKPKRETEAYKFDVDEYARNLTRITEDSHEEEILRKNNKRFVGRNSMYARNSNNVFLGSSIDQQSKSRAVRYLDKIDQNELKTSLERAKHLTNPQKVASYSVSHQTIQRPLINEAQDTTDDSLEVHTFGQRPANRQVFKQPTIQTKDQGTSAVLSAEKLDAINQEKIAQRIDELEKEQKQHALQLQKKSDTTALDLSNVNSSKPSQRNDQRQSFVQVPSVHELVIGRDVQTELKHQHQISQSFNEDRIEWLIQEYKPHSEPFKNIDISNFVIKKYKNGVYFGDIKTIDDKPVKDGYGSIFYYNGRLYEGQFQNDVKQGRGLELYPDNSRYEGYFENGQKSGKGRFTWGNGEIYDGQWLKGKKHGSGMWKSAGEEPYESYLGQWFEGKVEGFGVHTTAKGDRYEGQFKNSLKQGVGTERFQSGDVYVGAYFKGRQNGYGQYYYKSGDSYKGDFSNGLKHGKGIYKEIQTGNVFQGEFRNDKKCGHGEYIWSNGDVYIGNFENELRHGYGQMQTTKGKVYTGYWLNGKMFGENGVVNQTDRLVSKSPDDIADKSQTLSLYDKPTAKFKPKPNSNGKTISKSKSRSPEAFKSKSKKRLNQKSPEREPDSHYKRACGCNRHH